VARDLVEVADLSYTGVIQAYCQQAFFSDEDSALQVWNTMCRRRLLPLQPLDPGAGRIIGDPEFTMLKTGGGFGWHLFASDEIATGYTDDSRSLQIRFNGKEPDEFVLAEENLPPVLAGIRYRISFDAEVDPRSMVSGLIWSVVSIPEARIVAETKWDGAARRWPALEFVRTEAAPLQLRLRYRRPLGSTRANGGIVVRSVRGEVAR
jgi:hypothetical protein